VTQTDNSLAAIHTLSPTARLLWIVLILATLYICYFHNLGALGLVGPDEPRYAWIARDMAETGDWVTPRLYGEPWFEKPVLYYWGAALSFKLFGVSETAARLPSAIAALLSTLSMAWLAWRTYGAETARWLLLVLPTTVGMIGFAHAAATDMPFAGMLSIAMICAAVILGLVKDENTPILPRTPWLALLLFGFFLGLAALAKGPAAVLLSGGAVFLWAVCTRGWRDASRCLHPVAIASFCLTALPWYILCARRNPDFFRIFILEHNFKRYLTPEFQHIQPFWVYIPIVLLAVFPWTLHLIPATRELFTERQNPSKRTGLGVLLFCWPAFTIVFFSISKSKLPGYILPAVPPIALVLAKPIAAALGNQKHARRWPATLLGTGLIALAITVFLASAKRPNFANVYPAAGSALIFVAGVTALAAALVLLVGLFRNAKAGILAAISLLLLVVLQTDRLLTNLDPGLTARQAPIEAKRTWPDFSPTRAATWKLKRSLSYQLNFYTHVDLEEWKPSRAKPEWLFIDPNSREEARGLGFACSEYFVLPAVIPCRNYDSMDRLSSLSGLARGHLRHITHR
jgi:4-amino-4-deoxy-L-arabinose transferase-like glycosyltransferase